MFICLSKHVFLVSHQSSLSFSWQLYFVLTPLKDLLFDLVSCSCCCCWYLLLLLFCSHNHHYHRFVRLTTAIQFGANSNFKYIYWSAPSNEIILQYQQQATLYFGYSTMLRYATYIILCFVVDRLFLPIPFLLLWLDLSFCLLHRLLYGFGIFLLYHNNDQFKSIDCWIHTILSNSLSYCLDSKQHDSTIDVS